VKHNEEGQRANLGTEETKKQVAIKAIYSHEKSALHWLAAQKASKLYEDMDFAQFHHKGLWDAMKRLPMHSFRA